MLFGSLTIDDDPHCEPPSRKGAETRAAILDRAVDLASTDGLEGLTIGRLAGELEMSKSGLFAHFGSKQDLQLAAVEAAAARFREAVIEPAPRPPDGAPRLRAMADAYLAYLDSSAYSGGCFWAATSAEYDDRPGPVRDAIAAALDAWLGELERQAAIAGVADPDRFAFELYAVVMGANSRYRLSGDRARLRATPAGRPIASSRSCRDEPAAGEYVDRLRGASGRRAERRATRRGARRAGSPRRPDDPDDRSPSPTASGAFAEIFSPDRGPDRRGPALGRDRGRRPDRVHPQRHDSAAGRSPGEAVDRFVIGEDGLATERVSYFDSTPLLLAAARRPRVMARDSCAAGCAGCEVEPAQSSRPTWRRIETESE